MWGRNTRIGTYIDFFACSHTKSFGIDFIIYTADTRNLKTTLGMHA